MNKEKNKGLADNHDGEFILNESGTSVTIDMNNQLEESQEDEGEEINENSQKEETKDQ